MGLAAALARGPRAGAYSSLPAAFAPAHPVTTTSPSSIDEHSWAGHDQEARLLAELLRTSRLALLFGQAGSDKTSLLKNNLMPLLRRRSADRLGVVVARESGVVVPFPDRRSRSSGRAAKRRREIVIYFDDWADRPLEALHARLQLACAVQPEDPPEPRARLADTLGLLSGRVDANFIILLDRSEQLVTEAARSDIAEFTDELVDAINQARVPANFLIALDEAARPRLTDLRRRIPGFDDFSLKLGRSPPAKGAAVAEKQTASEPIAIRPPERPEETILEEPAAPAEAVPAPAANPAQTQPITGPAKPKQRTPLPRVAIKTEDVYKLIESTLSLTVIDGGHEPFPVRRSPPRPARATEPVSVPPPPTGFGAEPSVAVPLEASAAAPAPRKERPVAAALAWIGRLFRGKPRADG